MSLSKAFFLSRCLVLAQRDRRDMAETVDWDVKHGKNLGDITFVSCSVFKLCIIFIFTSYMYTMFFLAILVFITVMWRELN